MKHLIINGTGISGLLFALLKVESGYQGQIHLVDKAKVAGGLLRRYQYGENGDFDYGMHNFLETGVEALDALVFGLLPESEWDLLEGSRRDLCGIYYQDRLQTTTPYVDLRHLPKDKYEAGLADFLRHLGTVPEVATSTASAKDYFESKFGAVLAAQAMSPILEKIHKRPASELDFMATLFTPLSRVTLADEFLSDQLTASPWMRDRIAWGDQRTLPLERSSGRKAFYPKNYGMYRVVDALLARLHKAGVKVHLDAQITNLTTASNRVQQVAVQSSVGNFTLDEINQVIWTTASPILAKMLGVTMSDLGYDKPLRTVVVNLLLSQPVEAMQDLYYFFCYQPEFHTYRVTYFPNYCSGAVRGGKYPLSMELLVEDALVSGGNDLAIIAQDELRRLGMMRDGNQVVFAKAEILEGGFPMPTMKNIAATRTLRERIESLTLENLALVGILAKDNMFFQHDVLRYVHQITRHQTSSQC